MDSTEPTLYYEQMLWPLIRALRPTQWVKNVFVLAPIVFAERLTDAVVLHSAMLAFAAFCLAASTIYLFNDLRDRHDDRKHPLKKNRPIASGALPVPVAIATCLILGVVSFVVSFELGTEFAILLGVYIGINVVYSGFLKKVVILDVMAVSSGYVIRVMAGSSAIAVAVSNWLLLCTTFLALFLIFSKRRHELVLLAGDAASHRAVLGHYSEAFLDQMINVVTASTVVAYALYAVDGTTVERFGSDRLIYTIPLVLYGVFRYLYLIYQRPGKRNPTEAILTDWPSLINVMLWGLLVIWIVYG